MCVDFIYGLFAVLFVVVETIRSLGSIEIDKQKMVWVRDWQEKRKKYVTYEWLFIIVILFE